MTDNRKNHLSIDGAQVKEDEQNIGSYKSIPENDTDFRTSKSSIHKSKDKVSADGAEEKLLSKEEEAKIVTRVDMADAKYVVGDHRNGDAKIELDANKRNFTGLTKEELLKYADDPFWVRLRWFMFIMFWGLWLCMLAGAIAIIITAPKCAVPDPKTWYEKGVAIEMEKDLSEMTRQDFEELEKIHAEAAYVHVDSPYDILDKDVTKFKEQIALAKNIKVILSFALNYVPTSSAWFELSANRTAGYDSYFVWASPNKYNGTEPLPPNNWISTENTPAWQWVESRGQFYLHHFGVQEADLDFTNPDVLKHAEDVLAKWMKLGASGIRLEKGRELLVNLTAEDEKFARDAAALAADHTQYAFWRHQHASDHPALDKLFGKWSDVVKQSSIHDYPSVFTCLESEARPELFLLARDSSALRPRSARVLVRGDMRAVSKAVRDRLALWPAIKLSSPSGDSAELAAWAMLLPAAPVLTMDAFETDNGTSDSNSLAQVVRLREDVTVEHGACEVTAVPARGETDTLLAVARWKSGHTGYLAVYNPLPREAHADVSNVTSVPPALSVMHVSAAVSRATNYTVNLSVSSDDVLVPSLSSVVLSYVPVIGKQ